MNKVFKNFVLLLSIFLNVVFISLYYENESEKTEYTVEAGSQKEYKNG